MTIDVLNDGVRAAIVTGAGNGLGASFATALARRGDRVLVNNRVRTEGPPSAETLAAALRASGGDAVADLHAVDAPGAAEAIVGAALAAFGRLDVLVLNAGTSGPAAKIPTLPMAALHDVMAINFFANAALVTAALPHLLESPAGRILFISSSAGLYGVRGRSAYAASKGALTAYALTLADEQRRTSLGVNILCPYAATAMTATVGAAPDPRLTPDEAAAAAVWLTSTAFRQTGTVWIAGAGHIRRAGNVESASIGHVGATPEWLAEHATALSPIHDPRGFSGAEPAFADFYKSLPRD